MTTASNGRLAIAISLYDRWDELGGLLDLLRLNWPHGSDLHITVISTAEEQQMLSWINRDLIDNLQFGSPYPMPTLKVLAYVARIPTLRGFTTAHRTAVLKRVIRTRTVDSIIRGCRSGMETNKDYTLHLHAAAWPLLEDKIYELLDQMDRGKYVFAGRGYGKKWIDSKRPAGDIDDNFFVVNNTFARESGIWDFDPGLDADTVTNEGRLARRVYEICPENAILLYDRFKNPSDYLFPVGSDQRRIQPYNYFKPMGLLRSHDMRQQARLCGELNFSGPILAKIIAGEDLSS